MSCCGSLLVLMCLSKPLDHDEWRMFLPHYLIVWECQGSASRPVDNRGDMAGWSRARVQGALALDTQRAWACPRSHTAPGDDVMSHAPTPQQRLCLVSSLLCPGLGLLLHPQRARMPRDLWPRPLLGNRCAVTRWRDVGGIHYLVQLFRDKLAASLWSTIWLMGHRCFFFQTMTLLILTQLPKLNPTFVSDSCLIV